MAEKQTLKSWAGKQVHKPTDKISNFDKLKAPYIINEYETWGELYTAMGIETPKEVKKKKAKEVVSAGLSAQDINSGIPGGGVDPRNAAAYLNSDDPRLVEAARKILLAQSSGEMDLDGNPASTAITRREESTRLTTEADKKVTDKLEKEAFDKKVKANQDAEKSGYQVPYPDLSKEKPASVTAAENKTLSKTQSSAASAAALGLPASDLTRPSTNVEKVASDAAKTKDQVPPKVKGTPKGKTTPTLTDTQQREQALGIAEGTDFALPETIFNNVPSLKTILDRYVAEDWTADKLRKAIRDDVWYRQNSGAIKQRYVQLFNYRDLVKTGQAQGTTQYEQDIVKLERQIADKARQVGSAIASDPAALRKAAENMYITNVGIDDAMTTDFIAAAIRPIGSTIGGVGTEGYSGQALKDYQAIQSIARANGFRVKDIIPGAMSEQQVLQGIATGRLDANRIEQDARKLAAQGQPQYVRDLLSQGYNLDQVYAPYRQTMANLLEVNADEIDLNDSTLRSAISDKGDMNIFDFKKTLKRDSRWQYTENAKQEVSDMTLKILRDFGFQG